MSFFFKLETSNYRNGFPGGSDSKESACNAGDPGHEDPLEKGIATYSSDLPEESPWIEEPGGLGCKESDMSEQQLTLSLFSTIEIVGSEGKYA